jgi:hypothetical protein
MRGQQDRNASLVSKISNYWYYPRLSINRLQPALNMIINATIIRTPSISQLKLGPQKRQYIFPHGYVFRIVCNYSLCLDNTSIFSDHPSRHRHLQNKNVFACTCSSMAILTPNWYQRVCLLHLHQHFPLTGAHAQSSSVGTYPRSISTGSCDSLFIYNLISLNCLYRHSFWHEKKYTWIATSSWKRSWISTSSSTRPFHCRHRLPLPFAPFSLSVDKPKGSVSNESK